MQPCTLLKALTANQPGSYLNITVHFNWACFGISVSFHAFDLIDSVCNMKLYLSKFLFRSSTLFRVFSTDLSSYFFCKQEH